MRKKMAAAFNQWMQDYTENPEEFKDINHSAMEFLNEKLDGKEPTYGDECAALLSAYMDKADRWVGKDGHTPTDTPPTA